MAAVPTDTGPTTVAKHRRGSYSYARVPRGLLERPPLTTLSEPVQLFYLRLRTDSTAKPIPGLLLSGVGGLAERYAMPRSKVKKCVETLTDAALFLFFPNQI